MAASNQGNQGLPPTPATPVTPQAAGTAGVGGPYPVILTPPNVGALPSDVLWQVILNRSRARSFGRYKRYIDSVFGCESAAPEPDIELNQRLQGASVPNVHHPERTPRKRKDSPNFHGREAYEVLKAATNIFMEYECGLWLDVMNDAFPPDLSLTAGNVDGLRTDRDTNGVLQLITKAGQTRHLTLPYLAIVRERLADLVVKDDLPPSRSHDNCTGPLLSRLANPCLMELLWNYWHEESMMTQTLKLIGYQFQNRDVPKGYAPIRTLKFDALRPLSNLLWGWLQDEYERLSVKRRAHEYAHQYGLALQGAAVRGARPADSRTQFLSAFHELLNKCTVYYDQRDDMTRRADAFPVLNALRELHLVLAEGADNQFGDLTPTARGEALIEQWLLARPELRDFFGNRVMVPYPEDWMDRVDTMKSLQGWSSTSVTHYNLLAVFGEQLLLGVRYGGWMKVVDQAEAGVWADFWRSQVVGYVHAYRAVTGVNLAAREVQSRPIDITLPSVHIAQRLQAQRRGTVPQR
ncbi:MAG: hypothetical protein HY909_28115 [Deltaproteobacteria bacterium]|nr:hypothetical protein [Deltaproteobacteria bacterium]